MFNLQEDMYEQLKEKKGEVTVFLKNGVPVRGQILATDKFTVLMMVHSKQQLIYKQAISTLAISWVPPHIHQLKNSELPQNEKMSFLLQVSTKFRSGGYYKILAC